MGDDMSGTELSFNRKYIPYYIVGGIIAFCLLLLITNYGLLVGEKKTSVSGSATETYQIGGVAVPGNLIGNTFIRCSYFNGRGVVDITFTTNEGYHQCPFLTAIK